MDSISTVVSIIHLYLNNICITTASIHHFLTIYSISVLVIF